MTPRAAKFALICSVLLIAAIETSAFAQTPAQGVGVANMIDHIHLGVPDPAMGVQWYQKYFGGEKMAEAPDRLLFGQTRVIFAKNQTPKPSEGGVLDLIGFSVADLNAAVKKMQSDGVKIVMPVMTMEGMKVAQVTDPWGTLIEVVEDSSKLGLHHICLLSPDPAASGAWFADKFGGKVVKYRGKVDAINYGGVWLLEKKGDSVPSSGHAIDHMGLRPINLENVVAGLKAKNVKILTEPRPLTLANGTTVHLAFAEGPANVRIELVERPN
jgi:catechol 2,3-dioxygenase-like lactoylglutathione lyase family enzyme